MLVKRIDINVDMGEGLDNESQLMPYITSCNIACGGHAGTLDTMQKVVQCAKKYDVKIGAHPSFPDKEHFGRKPMAMLQDDLLKSLKEQINTLLAVVKEEQVTLHHIKPHGALYNMAVTDRDIAHTIIKAIKSIPFSLLLYAPYDSVMAEIAMMNDIPVMYEAFADRNYNPNGTLVSRAALNATIEDPDDVFKHVYKMISSHSVKTVSGSEIRIEADTFCVHGDNPNAVNLVKALKAKLENINIKLG